MRTPLGIVFGLVNSSDAFFCVTGILEGDTKGSDHFDRDP